MGVTANLGAQSEFNEEPTEEAIDVDQLDGDPPVAAPRTSVAASGSPRRRKIVTRVSVIAAGLFAVWHIAATALYAMPSTPLRELVPQAAFYAYNYPMFEQNWSVFAPDPIGADYEISVRATEVVDGEMVNTGWVNASKTEAKLLKHNPLSPRAGYASYSQALIYNPAYYNLSDTQKAVVAENYFEGDTWSQDLERDITAAGGADDAALYAYLKQEWITTAYATQVAKAVWGDDVVYVQYSVSVDNSVAFESRHDKDAVRSVVKIDSGWRGLVLRPGQDSQHFADLFNSLDPVIVDEEDTK